MKRNATLEEQRQVVLALEHAIFNIKFAAQMEQKATHAKHFCPHYRKVLEELELKEVGERTYLRRLEIIGV
jgi:hypothetical protein